MEKGSKVFVAGHLGLVGSAIMRNLEDKGFTHLITRTRSELELLDQAAVIDFFEREKPEYVIIAAAKVGGILFNQTYQAEFLYENLTISSHLIHAAHETGVKKLLFLGSSCIYPKHAPQPIKEESLLTGPLEPTNEGYALSKIAGLKLCEKYFEQYGDKFISAMPTNLYGPGDNFHPDHSHVIPGMMRRFHKAKIDNLPEVVIWGSGKPKREFLHVDDLAEALFVLMERYEEPGTINVGTGVDLSIYELAQLMKSTVGYEGEITLDSTKPDGTPRKVLDVSRITKLDWQPNYNLEEGLKQTYAWVQENKIFDQ
jgi:GDP-L-fucose synthase